MLHENLKGRIAVVTAAAEFFAVRLPKLLQSRVARLPCLI